MDFLKVTCRGFSSTDSIRESVEEQAKKLQQYYPKLNLCEVTIDHGHGRQKQGRIFHVQVHLGVPGEDIFINREPEKNHAHEELSVAIRDAFKAARRKLDDQTQINRGYVKAHTKETREIRAPKSEEESVALWTS